MIRRLLLTLLLLAVVAPSLGGSVVVVRRAAAGGGCSSLPFTDDFESYTLAEDISGATSNCWSLEDIYITFNSWNHCTDDATPCDEDSDCSAGTCDAGPKDAYMQWTALGGGSPSAIWDEPTATDDQCVCATITHIMGGGDMSSIILRAPGTGDNDSSTFFMAGPRPGLGNDFYMHVIHNDVDATVLRASSTLVQGDEYCVYIAGGDGGGGGGNDAFETVRVWINPTTDIATLNCNTATETCDYGDGCTSGWSEEDYDNANAVNAIGQKYCGLGQNDSTSNNVGWDDFYCNDGP